jgi:hypothetical protein
MSAYRAVVFVNCGKDCDMRGSLSVIYKSCRSSPHQPTTQAHACTEMFTALPHEAHLRVLDFLPVPDLFSLSLVNKELLQLVRWKFGCKLFTLHFCPPETHRWLYRKGIFSLCEEGWLKKVSCKIGCQENCKRDVKMLSELLELHKSITTLTLVGQRHYHHHIPSRYDTPCISDVDIAAICRAGEELSELNLQDRTKGCIRVTSAILPYVAGLKGLQVFRCQPQFGSTDTELYGFRGHHTPDSEINAFLAEAPKLKQLVISSPLHYNFSLPSLALQTDLEVLELGDKHSGRSSFPGYGRMIDQFIAENRHIALLEQFKCLRRLKKLTLPGFFCAGTDFGRHAWKLMDNFKQLKEISIGTERMVRIMEDGHRGILGRAEGFFARLLPTNSVPSDRVTSVIVALEDVSCWFTKPVFIHLTSAAIFVFPAFSDESGALFASKCPQLRHFVLSGHFKPEYVGGVTDSFVVKLLTYCPMLETLKVMCTYEITWHDHSNHNQLLHLTTPPVMNWDWYWNVHMDPYPRNCIRGRFLAEMQPHANIRKIKLFMGFPLPPPRGLDDLLALVKANCPRLTRLLHTTNHGKETIDEWEGVNYDDTLLKYYKFYNLC